ncbi:MAG TPA: hypothetical protein VF838_11765 [Trebonia sp.]
MAAAARPHGRPDRPRGQPDSQRDRHDRPLRRGPQGACEVADSTGELTVIFLGRAYIAGIEPGRRIRLEGSVGIGADGGPVMTNPAYELLP